MIGYVSIVFCLFQNPHIGNHKQVIDKIVTCFLTFDRLIKYDPASNRTEVLIKGLFFANGVQLSRKEDYVLVAETGMARILK